ncbi:hypothetical protein [Fluviispira multicolorata]|uniref:Tetratricopeptide repeat-containing protein n=1 Tax=Fluviispira multicolorata TaxID=2654512 RepID=A0A833JF73_9BACT|nr:hypothetical protein [Fluviispira multicolorata]KAB8030824.1 hypothetical protein GCL57_07570 [Fluviispira multicolorata]
MSFIHIAQKKMRFISNIAILFMAVFITSCSTTFLSSERSIIQKKQDLKNNLEALFQNKFNQQDFDLVSSTYSVFTAFQNIRENNFEKANNISKNILYTKGLSASTYKFAFKAYSISSILMINENISNKKLNEGFDFFSFQNNQCEILCDSFGWKVLAHDNSSLFSQKGYQEELLSEDFFAFVNKEKPHWISESLFFQENASSFKSYDKRLVNIKRVSEINLDTEDSLENEKRSKEEKIALNYFLNGEFQKSKNLFLNLVENTSNSLEKSNYYYWIGRIYSAQNNSAEAKKYFLKSGIENPLSLYDSLSGQIVKNSSGRSSTTELSPFAESWEREMEKWISYPTFVSNSDIIISLKSAIILASKIKLENNISRLDDYQDYIGKHESIESFLLKDEINWLKKKWQEEYKHWPINEKPDVIGNNISWLLFLTGQHVQSIIFVSHIKNSLDPFSENNNFLYFLFYPRLYKSEVNLAIKQCPVDPDLIYAILRQEEFYNFNIENKDSILKKTCLLKTRLNIYKNGIVNSLSAYLVGVDLTNEWLKHKSQINDDAVFMETIPDEKAKYFVQETVKNYYNIKWIYFKKNSISEALLNLLFAYER